MTEPVVVQPQTLDPQSPSAAAQALQSLQDRPSETAPAEAIKPSSKTLVEVEGVTYKRCTHCKELKIRDQNFNKDKSRGDGFACTCKACANRHTRAWHERHKQQVHTFGTLTDYAVFPTYNCAHCEAYNCDATPRLTATRWSAELCQHCSRRRQPATASTVQSLQGVQATGCLLWRYKPSKWSTSPLQVDSSAHHLCCKHKGRHGARTPLHYPVLKPLQTCNGDWLTLMYCAITFSNRSELLMSSSLTFCAHLSAE